MEIRIRPASTEDIPEMVKLLCGAASRDKDSPLERKRKEKGLTMMIGASEERMALVAEKGDEIVGMVTGQIVVSGSLGGLSALVEDLVVAAACRGKGIGLRLLTGIEGWARSLGAARLQLLTDAGNAVPGDFYDKAGWKPSNLLCRTK